MARSINLDLANHTIIFLHCNDFHFILLFFFFVVLMDHIFIKYVFDLLSHRNKYF